MNNAPEYLQSLYEALKASKTGKHISKINWTDWPSVLSIRNSWGGEHEDTIIHIRVDKNHPGKFTYDAISNKGMNNSEKYLTVEEKAGVSQEAIIEVAYRLLTPQT